MHERIWYTQPARDWIEGLPIGTGRLAAMVLGSYKRERIALNHEWLWKGTNRNRENRKVAERLPEVRELLLAGKYREGTLAGNRAFASFWDVPPEAGPKNRVDPPDPDRRLERLRRRSVEGACPHWNDHETSGRLALHRRARAPALRVS